MRERDRERDREVRSESEWEREKEINRIQASQSHSQCDRRAALTDSVHDSVYAWVHVTSLANTLRFLDLLIVSQNCGRTFWLVHSFTSDTCSGFGLNLDLTGQSEYSCVWSVVCMVIHEEKCIRYLSCCMEKPCAANFVLKSVCV